MDRNTETDHKEKYDHTYTERERREREERERKRERGAIQVHCFTINHILERPFKVYCSDILELNFSPCDIIMYVFASFMVLIMLHLGKRGSREFF